MSAADLSLPQLTYLPLPICEIWGELVVHTVHLLLIMLLDEICNSVLALCRLVKTLEES